MRGKALGIYTFVMLIAGLCLGQTLFQVGVPDPVVIHDTKTVTETEYVTEYVEVEADPATVTVTRVPESCLRVAENGRDAGKAASTLSTNGTLTIDLISEARQAIQLNDINGLNDIETAMRDLGETSQSALTIVADSTLDYDTDLLDCREQASND